MTHKRALLTVSAGIAGLAGVALATAGQTDTAQAATQTATITYKDGGTTVWGSTDYTQPKSYVSYQQQVDVYGSKTVGSTTWYLVGDNAWIPAEYVSLNNQAVEQAPKPVEVAPSNDQQTNNQQTQNTTNTQTPQTPTNTQTPATDQSAGTTDQTKAQQVIALAEQQIGKPYVWGGKGPANFDCSGLMQYVFKNAANVDVGGWTVPQESAGTQIAVNQAQPGDMLFWGDKGSTYHVALYIGNGQYINAPVPGKNVEIDSISPYFAPSFAVRVL